MNKPKTLRAGAAGVALLAVSMLGATGGAQAEVQDKAGATVIKMERDGRELFFSGPTTVAAGASLKIKNKTNPRQIGPHTFSLVKPKYLPESRQQLKDCAKELAGICGKIIRWHDIDLENFVIGENPAKAGEPGWDQEGTLKRKGDSWFTLRKDESFAQEVNRAPGTNLTYFCLVHPEMQGEITVTE